MREAYRPFTKVVTVTGTTKVIIPLVDSSGVSVDANYVQVEAVSGGGGDYFLVSPSGLSFSEPDASFKIANNIDNHVSGTPGAVASIETGSVIFSLPPRDTISSIILSQTTTTATTYAITYGVVNVVNALADNRKRVGG